MASASYENGGVTRAPISGRRRRADLRPLDGGRAGGATALRGAAQRAGARAPLGGFARGVAASLLIASGYVALVTAVRALLSPA